jgi:antitoxin (DNA-binding transcriptional repressor) of toxin-antitoxin stability system
MNAPPAAGKVVDRDLRQMYLLYMSRLPLTTVRRRLPALVRLAEGGAVVEITNRGRVVARLMAPANDVATTADALLAVRGKGRRARGRGNVSARKNEHLTRPRR